MFENYISLGSNCNTALALSKLGLRTCKGPFDWQTSSFEGIITLLENDFKDFLKYENLVICKDNQKTFDDIKHKINYNHDIKTNLQDDYNSIFEDYQKRIDKFRKMVKKPTCFIRICWQADELSFIKKNENRINKAIAFNPDNEIIFVVPRFIYNRNPINIKRKIFIIDRELTGFELGRDEGSCIFDVNNDLIEYLISNYDEQKRKDNLILALQSELEIAKRPFKESAVIEQLKKEIKQLNYRLIRLTNVANADYSKVIYTEKISIYGFADIGKILYKNIKNYTNIIEFIDRSPREDFYDNIPVVKPENIKKDKDITIIVVPTYDYDSIVDDLTSNLGFTPKAIKLEEFLSTGKILGSNF